MTDSSIYIILTIFLLLVVLILIVLINRRKGERPGHLSPLAMLAFGFILSGVIFNEDVRIGYGLIGIGVVVAIVDIVVKLSKR